MVEPPCEWKPDQPVSIGQASCDIIHAEPDKLWLHSVANVDIWSSVFQDRYIGEVTEMFHQFGEAWRKRWERHIDTDEAKWEPIIEVAKMVLDPPQEMTYSPISYEEWIRSLQRKKRRSAVGPDGFAREDLINMPNWITVRLLNMVVCHWARRNRAHSSHNRIRSFTGENSECHQGRSVPPNYYILDSFSKLGVHQKSWNLETSCKDCP